MRRLYGIIDTPLRTFGIESVLNPGDVLVVTDLNTLQSVSGYFEQADDTAIPQLFYANGIWQELTNEACIGFSMPTDFTFTGQEFQVTNSTGTTLAGGDFAIPNDACWTFGWNGSAWKVKGIS